MVIPRRVSTHPSDPASGATSCSSTELSLTGCVHGTATCECAAGMSHRTVAGLEELLVGGQVRARLGLVAGLPARRGVSDVVSVTWWQLCELSNQVQVLKFSTRKSPAITNWQG